MDDSTAPIVPRPETVWLVPLGRGPEGSDGVKGRLWIEDVPERGAEPCVRFTEIQSEREHRFPFAAIHKVRRVRGSPILIIDHQAPTADRRREQVAFFFTKPPPLRPPEPGSDDVPDVRLRTHGFRALMPSSRRPSKRRHQRSNVGYLTTVGTNKKAVLQSWVTAVRARLIQR